MMRNVIVLLCCLWISPLWAWNAQGHFLVAQIAWEELQPSVRERVEALVHELDDEWRVYNFTYAANWADRIKGDKRYDAYQSWHYIDLPFSADGTATQQPVVQNVVWAIYQAEKALQDPSTAKMDKSFYLRFLIHLVGDVHQPMHCIDRFSAQYPRGDQGGNWYPIDATFADNLHKYWDRGAGYFKQKIPHRRWHSWQIRRLAREMMRNHPRVEFGKALRNQNIRSWAEDCHQLARRHAYNIKPGARPSKHYQQQSQHIVQQQIALAGYRLADILNRLFA